MRLARPTSSCSRSNTRSLHLQHIAPCFPCTLRHHSVGSSAPQHARCTVKAAISTSGDAEAAAAFDRRAGRSTYRPASFKILVEDAANSVVEALNEGDTRMEVEFPVLPGQDVRTYWWWWWWCTADSKRCIIHARGVQHAGGVVKAPHNTPHRPTIPTIPLQQGTRAAQMHLSTHLYSSHSPVHEKSMQKLASASTSWFLMRANSIALQKCSSPVWNSHLVSLWGF